MGKKVIEEDAASLRWVVEKTPEQLDDKKRNEWSTKIGISGRFHRNTQKGR